MSLDRLLPVLESLAVSTRHLGRSTGLRQSGKRQLDDVARVLNPVLSALPGGRDG